MSEGYTNETEQLGGCQRLKAAHFCFAQSANGPQNICQQGSCGQGAELCSVFNRTALSGLITPWEALWQLRLCLPFFAIAETSAESSAACVCTALTRGRPAPQSVDCTGGQGPHCTPMLQGLYIPVP